MALQLNLSVADEIQVELTSQERARLSRALSVNPEAYADYLRGRSVLAGGPGSLSKLASKREYTEQDIQTAIAYFKSSIDKDPAYAQAYAGFADALIQLGTLVGEVIPRRRPCRTLKRRPPRH